jgi:hypothetical protein
MGLISRLVLGDSSFVSQFAHAVKDEEVSNPPSAYTILKFLISGNEVPP